jgi:HTH-type transcriptional regulator, bacterioopsin transcriptional activator and related proteins
MGSSTPSSATVRAVFDQLGPPGTPFTTSEIAAEFDCSDRTIYNRLDALVDKGIIETKKVGARGRVWWKPVKPEQERREESHEGRAQVCSHPVFDSEQVGVIVWDGDVTIREANDAFLDMAGLDYQEALGTSWRDLTPEEFYLDSECHLQQIKETGNGIPYEKQYYHADGSRWWGLFESRTLNDSEFVEFVIDITERKQHEQALRENKERLDAFVTATSDAVYRMSLDWSEMCYLEGREFIPDTEKIRATWLEEYIPEDERKRVVAAIDEAIETRDTFELEHEVVQVDGTRGWIQSYAVPILDDDGDIIEWFGAATDITERKRTEQRVRESEAKYRTLFESIDEGFAIIEMLFDEDDDPVDYRFLEANPAIEDQAGLTNIEGRRMREIAPDLEEHWFQRYGRIARTGEAERFQEKAEHLGGRWFNVYAFRIGEPEERKVATLVDDITERKRAEQARKESEEALERLNAATQELIDAEAATIADRVAPLVREVLDVEYATLWQYDDQSGDLEKRATDISPDVDGEAVDFSTEIADQVWETFVGTDVGVENDLDVQPDVTSPLRSCAFLPLGHHGVICLGSTEADTFDGRAVDLMKTAAATVETAWDRTAGEEELAQRNEELQHLDRLNTLIREIDQALVAASTREEIDEAVCKQLASSDLYEFAWLGESDPETDRIEPRAWAGVDSGYVEDLTIIVEDTPTNRDPITSAVRTGDLQVVADIATDSSFAPWREATLERGARSLVCIPLVYDDAAHGVLTVYADHPQSDKDKRNRDVLSELGNTIAHTLNARETRATLQTDCVVELTLRFDDADTPLCRLARETGCTIEHQGFVPRSSGQIDVFFIARETSREELRATAKRSLAFDDLNCLSEGTDGALFRVRVSEPTLASRVTDEGAVVRSITIDAGVATVVLDVPHTAAVREFLDRLHQWHPNIELRARQSCERPLKTQQTFVMALEDHLTDRQREVLQTAYLSGFFEMPRVSNGQEVTDLLDVSQPTFSEHLRAAERTLCDVLFESESYADDIIST